MSDENPTPEEADAAMVEITRILTKAGVNPQTVPYMVERFIATMHQEILTGLAAGGSYKPHAVPRTFVTSKK